MVIDLKRMYLYIAGLLSVLVISLCGTASAAPMPAITTLDPIVSGVMTPMRIALDLNGDFYVADPKAGGVVKFDRYGAVLQTIKPSVSTRSIALLDPVKNGNMSGGKLLVEQRNYVSVLDSAGSEVGKLMNGVSPYRFTKVGAMAVDRSSGDIYVVDLRVVAGTTAAGVPIASGNNEVVVFNNSGFYVSKFGGYNQGIFASPVALAVVTDVDPAKTQIAVLDALLGNVQFFTKAGVAVNKKIGRGVALNSTDTSAGGLVFNYPSAFSVEYKNGSAYRIYILDMYQGKIHIADAATGTFVGYVSGGDSRAKLLSPSDIQYDAINGRLLLANGLSNIVSFGIDGGKNPSYVAPPVLEIVTSVVTGSKAVLTGTVDPGCSVSALVDNNLAVVGPVSVSAGKWSLVVEDLKPGTNALEVKATRAVDNAVAVKVANLIFQQPSVRLVVNPTPDMTNLTSIVIGGTTEAGAVVAVTNGSTATTGRVSYSVAPDGRNINWLSAVTLREGENSINVIATKPGSESASDPRLVICDTKAPIAQVSSVPSGSVVSSAVLGLSGTVVEKHSPIVRVNGDNIFTVRVGDDKALFNSAVALKRGINQLEIVAVDAVGNQTSEIRNIVYDPEYPMFAVSTPVDLSYTNKDHATVAGSANPNWTVAVSGVPAVKSASDPSTWSATVKLQPGINTILIHATDESGRTSVEKRTVLYDSANPLVSIINPAKDFATRDANVTIDVLALDNSGAIPSLSGTIDGYDIDPSFIAYVPSGNGNGVKAYNFRLSIPLMYANETSSLVITATDKAGNSTTVHRSIIFDTTSPLFDVDRTENPYPSILSGSVELDGKVKCYDSDGPVGTVVLNKDKWSADLTTREYDYKTLACSATDAAGNITEKTVNLPDPDGDVNGDGVVDVMDAIAVIKIWLRGGTPSYNELKRGDVGPLVKGKASRNGTLDITDAILILKKGLGIVTF